MDAPAADLRGGGGLLLVCRVRLEHELANALLRCGVDDGPEKRERTTFTVHRVLARRKCHVAARTAAALPDREANELETFERASGEVQLCLGELSNGVALVVRLNLDCHVCRSHLSLLDPAFLRSLRIQRDPNAGREAARTGRRRTEPMAPA